MAASSRQLPGGDQADATPAPAPALAHVVPLGPQGAGPPLIFVHASDGSALPYLALARELGDRHRCVAIEASWPARPPGDSGPVNLADLADGYAEEITGTCGRGPYQLAGWSLGGALAFAVAVALRRRRQQVAMLALIDPVTRPGTELPPDRAATLALFARSAAHSVGAARVPISAADLRGLAPAEQDHRVLDALAGAGVIPRGAASLSLAQARMFTFEALLTALASWRPGRFDGRIDVLVCAKRPAERPPRGWADLTTGPTVTHRVDGDHYTILRPPLVTQVSQVFTRLTRAAAGLP